MAAKTPAAPANGRFWLTAVSWVAALGLIGAQAAAYFFRLDLSLGPRVIMQPWLLARGFTMYEQAADLHSPLVPLVLAVLRALIPDGLLLGKTMLVALLSIATLLTFLAVRRAAGRGAAGALAGLGAAFFFVCWTRSFWFFKLWHESFLAPLYALLLLLPPPARAQTQRRPTLLRLALAGLVCGLALLTKQHAVLVLAVYALWTVLAARAWRTAAQWGAVFLGTAALPVIAWAIIHYAQAGTLAGAWYWVVAYSLTSGYRGQTSLAPTVAEVQVLTQAALLLPAALAALVPAGRHHASDGGKSIQRHLGWGLTLLIAASATAYPRFGMFHLQPALPALAFVSALTLVYAWRAWSSARPFTIGIVLGVTVLCAALIAGPIRIALDRGRTRHIAEYSDLVPLADDLRARIGPTDHIYIYPDDEATANLYYLLQREPPRFWIFHYSWYMLEPIQGRIVDALATSPPQWVVYFAERWSEPGNAALVTQYLAAHYQQVDTLSWADGQVHLLQRID